jgi:hypothetical protein
MVRVVRSSPHPPVESFIRSGVGKDIDAHALVNEGNVVSYMESQLKAGYSDITRRQLLWGMTSDLTATDRSIMNPQGTDATPVFYPAKFCSDEGLLFGRTSGGAWTVPLRP